jgi:hypothetical protein
VIARRQRSSIEDERDVIIEAAEPNVQFRERLGETFEVLGLRSQQMSVSRVTVGEPKSRAPTPPMTTNPTA